MWDWIIRLFTGARNIVGHEDRLVALEARANDHEKRIQFLEVYREVFRDALAKIHELQAIQSNQAVRLGNLAQLVDAELIPRLEQLETMAPDETDRTAVINLRKQVKNNLTRARKKVEA